MMPMDWAWLAVTLVQVLGLSIALAALGFAYEHTVQKRVSLLTALQQGGLLGWLALGAALLAGGMAFSGANIVQKGSALGLAVCLAWMARSD